MVETEMSMQSDLILSNSYSRQSDNYSKIEEKEEYFIDKKDIILEAKSKESNKQNNIIYPVNSDQLLQTPKKYFYKKLGNTYSFFGDKYGNPIIIIGPHWYLYISVTIFFTLCFLLEMIYIGKYISTILKVVGFIIYFTFLFSYSYTALINPGYKKYDMNSITGEQRNKFSYCQICKMYINNEKKTRHCYYCNICIERHDHHCPWTGKCIGEKNLISFFIFVISIFLLFAHFVCVMTSFNKESFKKKII